MEVTIPLEDLKKTLLNQKSVNEQLDNKAWSQHFLLFQLRLAGILCSVLPVSPYGLY